MSENQTLPKTYGLQSPSQRIHAMGKTEAEAKCVSDQINAEIKVERREIGRKWFGATIYALLIGPSESGTLLFIFFRAYLAPT